MKLEFKINKFALARDAFVQNNHAREKKEKIPFPFWVKLENTFWNKFCDEPSYYLITPQHHDWALNELHISAGEKGFQNTFLDTSKKLEKIYQEITKSKEFKRLLLETEKYKIFVEKQWKENEKFVLDYFKNVLHLKIPDYSITVYIFHPKSHHGQANNKHILWGHSEDWKNYTTVYLAHEILHIITCGKFKDFETMHILIELSTDNELRIRLNKNGRYFTSKKSSAKMPLFLKKLWELEKEIIPYWKEYLKNQKGRSIIDLEKEIKGKIKN